jgi:hypothetical protein
MRANRSPRVEPLWVLSPTVQHLEALRRPTTHPALGSIKMNDQRGFARSGVNRQSRTCGPSAVAGILGRQLQIVSILFGMLVAGASNPIRQSFFYVCADLARRLHPEKPPIDSCNTGG